MAPGGRGTEADDGGCCCSGDSGCAPLDAVRRRVGTGGDAPSTGPSMYAMRALSSASSATLVGVI